MNLPVNYDKLHYTQRRVVRNQYVEEQGGRCYYCDALLTSSPRDDVVNQLEIDRELFPENFFDYPVHLHHDHQTGMTIGAVHNYCNAVLWQYHGE